MHDGSSSFLTFCFGATVSATMIYIVLGGEDDEL